MDTRIFFERKSTEDFLIEETAKVLNNGGVVVVPTDTVPGIGCRVDNLDALNRIFELKNRPSDLAVPVILSEPEQVEEYCHNVSPLFYKLAERFWPGALTIILRSNGKIDRRIGGGGDTIGFRIPDFELLPSLVKSISCPLALTSANPHGESPDGLHSAILNWWNHKVDLIILGKSTAPRPPSTVIDLTSDPACLLREATIKKDIIEPILE